MTPAVVAIGGGHGLAATLRAVRRYTERLTGVVSVADDGGSSGRLRDLTGMPAPGDLRRCLTALAPDDSVLARALEHRFEEGELEGHAVGNVLIAGLAAATGDFVAALHEVGALLGSAGTVLPATPIPVQLAADTTGGHVDGQVAVQESAGIRRVALVPSDAPATAGVVDALAAADQIVLGPGSLYTSVLAAVLVPEVRDAVARSTARKVYVCNLAPQVPETEGYDVAAHVAALVDHGVKVDVVLCHPGALALGDVGVSVVERAIARPHGRAHAPELLAAALAELL